MSSRTEGKAWLKSQSAQSPAAKGVVGKGTAEQGPAPPLLRCSLEVPPAFPGINSHDEFGSPLLQ